MKAQTISFMMVVLFFTSCNNQQNTQVPKDKENTIKGNLNTLVETCWNKKELASLKLITTDDVIRKVNGVTVSSNQNELEASMTIFIIGFPDLVITNPNIYIQGNLAFVDFTFYIFWNQHRCICRNTSNRKKGKSKWILHSAF